MFSCLLPHVEIKQPQMHLSIIILTNQTQTRKLFFTKHYPINVILTPLFFSWWQCGDTTKQGVGRVFTGSSSVQKMVCELSSVTWSVVAGSRRAVSRHACLPTGPLGLEPLCAPLPNQAAQYAEQPPWRPQSSAPSRWPPLKLWCRAGMRCAQSAGARCQMGWMAEIVMQRNKRAWIR